MWGWSLFSLRLQWWVIRVTFQWEPPVSESVSLFLDRSVPRQVSSTLLPCLEGICLTDCHLRAEWGKGPVYLLVCRPFTGSPCFQNSNSVLPCTNHSKKMDLSSAGLGKGIHQGVSPLVLPPTRWGKQSPDLGLCAPAFRGVL